MSEFDHTIPSNILHELEDVKSVNEYFSREVQPTDKLVAMAEEHAQKSNLPPNLVLQINPIRFNPNDNTFFPTTAFPGRSTIVSGIATSKKYPSYKASKERRVRIDLEDRV